MSDCIEQKKILEMQKKCINNLDSAINDIKEMSLQINEELTNQNKNLEELHSGVLLSNDEIKKSEKETKKVCNYYNKCIIC